MPPSFVADTELDCVVKPGLGWKRGKLERYPRRTYSAIITHTTGLGVHRKAQRWGVDPFDATLRIFGNQINTSGHYVVGQGENQLAQVVPECMAAWHVGGSGYRKYYRARWWEDPKVAWWRERWPQFTSPGELANGLLWLPSPATGRPSCNANTIGIEVVPPPDNGPWSVACWETLGKLHWDISGRRSIELSLETVLSHSDAHPYSRSARGKPWDPAPTQWGFDTFAEVAGLPLISGVGSHE